MEENKNEGISNIISIALSNNLPIEIKPMMGRKWVLNGDDNSNYKLYKDCYDDSPTNASIINSYSHYIYGDGLIDENGQVIKNTEGKVLNNTQRTNIERYLSKKDLRLMVKDFKINGAFAVQVIWNKNKKPVLMKYIPIRNIGLQIDQQLRTTGYWYSWDWKNKGKYVPVLYPKFDGKYKGSDVEIHIVENATSDPFFTTPDWLSAVRYAQAEAEIANSRYNHIINGFQGSKMINFNNGIPPTEELKRRYKSEIDNNLRGPRNSNKYFITFNQSKETAPEIIDLTGSNINEEYAEMTLECEKKLIIAHKAPPILFSGSREGGGLGNNSEEIKTATQMLYRDIINPLREIITDGLNEVFNVIDPMLSIAFADFKEFKSEEQKNVDETGVKTTDVQMEKKKVELKTWRSNSTSSNVDRMKWNDENLELVIKFNDGSTYTYFGIHQEKFIAVSQGYTKCTTSGSNEYGEWWVNKSPSVGSAVHKYLDGVSYTEGGSLR